MSQRLLHNTKWLCCLLAMQAGSFWGQARSVTARNPPGNPSTIEAQAKFFQDFFSVQLSPYKIEFGHVCEDPNTWEQRYEKKDFKNHRDMGKVRWGDKKGGYGEHYWDLNHAGHTSDNYDDDGYYGDDGSHHESSHNDPYDEPSENSPTYGTEDYDPEKASYEESARAKRAHPKIKVDKKQHKQKTDTHEEENKTEKHKRKNREELEEADTQQDEEYSDDEVEVYEKPKPKRQKPKKEEDDNQQYKKQKDNEPQPNETPKEKNQFVLVVSHKDDSEKQKQQYQPQYTTRQPEFPQYLPRKQPELHQYLPQPTLPQYVPYEGGAGVRQHQQPEVSAATTVPRLFLEPSTGHVVDRATGQAYVLQPITTPKNYN